MEYLKLFPITKKQYIFFLVALPDMTAERAKQPKL